ncbi:uncharacterized protein LOC111358602 [Spodoptera litura]|uniref:Uncharacterized protein LOC111348061 n=1 Tax=Spodoptera litura TaxID=69820 RepID=A0A9J7IIJ1_SPOLT|nr:uncharacterized protein LOC111348061 [Spodoptera litura]XP_022829582.1 uncharacterized protein LOC111358602 [Spodoptera litura]
MAASFNPGASARARITDDAIFEQLMDGNLSEIEDFSDNDLDFELNNLFDQLDCEDLCDGDIPNEDEEISHQLSPLICSRVIQPPSTSMPQPSASMTQHPSPTTTQSQAAVQAVRSRSLLQYKLSWDVFLILDCLCIGGLVLGWKLSAV